MIGGDGGGKCEECRSWLVAGKCNTKGCTNKK